MSACGHASWEAFATSVVLRVVDPGAVAVARAAVERELEAIDRACSRFRPDSELSRVNGARGRAVSVSPLLAEALQEALRAAELSEGDVDPTVGSALVLAGYDRDLRLLDPPRSAPVRERVRSAEGERGARAPERADRSMTVRALRGWRAISLERDACRVRVPSGITLDLGASAKAWAADRAAAVAASAAGCGALVAIGGDIATCGEAPAGGWRIRVTDDHRGAPTAPGQTITIASGAVATSSTSTRRWAHRGQTMHHIIDPATGAPAGELWRTASAAAASCADANIATTAAIVRGGSAPQWLDQLGLPARLVSRAGEVVLVGAWPSEETAGERPADRRVPA